jgi:hypothetical protein
MNKKTIMHALHHGIQAFEDAIVKNKWFTLACVSLLVLSSVGIMSVQHVSDGGAGCYLDAERALFGDRKHRIFAHEVAPETVTFARTHYSVCLLTNGIDVRSVPAFEELFPFTAELGPYALPAENLDEDYTEDDVSMPLE